MLYLVNPRKRKRAKKAKSRKRPSAKQLAARRKFARMAKARSRAARKRTRASGSTTMAKRRRRTVAKSRRRSRRRSPVTTLRRRSVYLTNPRRKRGRRRYRRNPGMGRGIVGQVVGLGTDAVVALAGGAAGRVVSGLIPVGGSPITDFAKSALVAVAIRQFGSRFLGPDKARIAALGAMLGPTKNLIVSLVPQAEGFLGRSDQVMYFPGGSASMGAYSGAVDQGIVGDDTGMSSYSEVVY